MTETRGRVLLTGATGFVGRHLYPELVAKGFQVRCASRRPAAARTRFPDRDWVQLDVLEEDSVRAALTGCDSAIYLVHAMAGGPGYRRREQEGATAVARAAREIGLDRLVYLGGVEPRRSTSAHLMSRLETGRILREGFDGTIELRAGMIIGDGSESWQICRDLAARLPVMILPKWLQSRSQPVFIDDVVAALAHAVADRALGSTVFDIPGAETLSAAEILFRIAALRGIRTRSVTVPVLTPRLSSYWLGLVTRAKVTVARELVEGLVSDLVATQPLYWDYMGGHEPVGFDQAAARVLADEVPAPLRARAVERLARHVAAKP